MLVVVSPVNLPSSLAALEKGAGLASSTSESGRVAVSKEGRPSTNVRLIVPSPLSISLNLVSMDGRVRVPVTTSASVVAASIQQRMCLCLSVVGDSQEASERLSGQCRSEHALLVGFKSLFLSSVPLHAARARSSTIVICQ